MHNFFFFDKLSPATAGLLPTIIAASSAQLFTNNTFSKTTPYHSVRQMEMRGLEPLTSALQRRRSPI